MKQYVELVNRFETIVKEKRKDQTLPALIIDSPWLPGYAGINTLDFYFDQDAWLNAYVKARKEMPGALFIPGPWAEFGMAAEPSGFSCKIKWQRDFPPSVIPCPGGLDQVLKEGVPDPERDGLMPFALRRYETSLKYLKVLGLAPRMAAARGPLAVASHLIGINDLLLALKLEEENCLALLEITTQLCVKWLTAQLERMDDPIGVLVLDDVTGMMGSDDAERFAFPFLKKIFDAFKDKIHIFHNDTPNNKVYPGLERIGVDVFNFSHLCPMEEARKLVGPNIVLMGNLPPLDLVVKGTPDQVTRATKELLDQVKEYGPILVSPGGGVSPGAPIENLIALVEAVS